MITACLYAGKTMRTVSASEGLIWVRTRGLPGPGDELASAGFFWESAYRIPPDSGRKTALARLLANHLAGSTESMLWIHGYGIWPSSENPKLFVAVRRAFGENRPLASAPCHLYTEADRDYVECLVDLALYFVWDVMILQQDAVVCLSHDEVLQVSARETASHATLDELLAQFGLEPI